MAMRRAYPSCYSRSNGGSSTETTSTSNGHYTRTRSSSSLTSKSSNFQGFQVPDMPSTSTTETSELVRASGFSIVHQLGSDSKGRQQKQLSSPPSSSPKGMADARSGLSVMLEDAIVLLPDTFYYVSIPEGQELDRKFEQNCQFVDTRKYTYIPFFADFGPVNLGRLYRFCETVDKAFSSSSTEKVCCFSTDHPHQRSNAAFLVASYLVIRYSLPPEEAFAPFLGNLPPLLAFRDAAFGLCTYQLTVLDCLRAVAAAIRHNILDMSKFDISKYEYDEQLCNGDINWIVPGRFCAFSGPLDSPKELDENTYTWTAAKYAEYFKANNVGVVIRLNQPCYDKRAFTRAGIDHFDLYYPDGGLPPQDILSKFLRICENAHHISKQKSQRGEPCAVGVHCKAGLGRTGTCIGAYLMKHFGFTAREATAWERICRPGCVLGPQQQYLEAIQLKMWGEGKLPSSVPQHVFDGAYTLRAHRTTSAAFDNAMDDILSNEFAVPQHYKLYWHQVEGKENQFRAGGVSSSENIGRLIQRNNSDIRGDANVRQLAKEDDVGCLEVPVLDLSEGPKIRYNSYKIEIQHDDSSSFGSPNMFQLDYASDKSSLSPSPVANSHMRLLETPPIRSPSPSSAFLASSMKGNSPAASTNSTLQRRAYSLAMALGHDNSGGAPTPSAEVAEGISGEPVGFSPEDRSRFASSDNDSVSSAEGTPNRNRRLSPLNPGSRRSFMAGEKNQSSPLVPQNSNQTDTSLEELRGNEDFPPTSKPVPSRFRSPSSL